MAWIEPRCDERDLQFAAGLTPRLQCADVATGCRGPFLLCCCLPGDLYESPCHYD